MKLYRRSFAKGVNDAITLKPLRWWLFLRLSKFGWWILPEPHKSNLQSVMPRWADYPHGKDCTIQNCPHCGGPKLR